MKGSATRQCDCCTRETSRSSSPPKPLRHHFDARIRDRGIRTFLRLNSTNSNVAAVFEFLIWGRARGAEGRQPQPCRRFVQRCERWCARCSLASAVTTRQLIVSLHSRCFVTFAGGVSGLCQDTRGWAGETTPTLPRPAQPQWHPTSPPPPVHVASSLCSLFA
jgi:hypothetical protein